MRLRSVAATVAAAPFAFALGLTLATAPSLAADALTVHDAWARATPGRAANGGGFLVVENPGSTDDAIVSASAPVAETVELHTHVHDGTVMRMRQVDEIPVPAGGAATLEPGGYHVMFIGLHAPLAEGDRFPVTLTFEHAEPVTVEMTVKAVGAMGSGPGMKHGHGQGQGTMPPMPKAQ